MITKTKQGPSCRTCGTTEKYVSNGQCTHCQRERQSKWNLANMRQVLSTQRRLKALKYLSDTNFRVNRILQTTVNSLLQTGGEDFRLSYILGYSIWDLRKQLESTFTDEMNWSNYGVGGDYWSIDHLKPISNFNISGTMDPQLRVLWALSNIRACWNPINAISWRQ